MECDALFKEEQQVKTITPYRKLRELRGWSLDEAAEVFHISRKTLINIELGRSDASKQLVRNEIYGCKGALIEYWLPKFSYAGENGELSEQRKTPQTVCERFRAWVNGLIEL